MKTEEFASFRKQLGKTQKQMARLLGVSIKAIHSYEQGWRSVPDHIEKQMLLLMVQSRNRAKPRKCCWDIYQCPPERRDQCPAWEFQAGDLCWFISGTFCNGKDQKNWKEKMRLCRACDMLTGIL
ncbi:MAG: helix-turn-helix transcriptional regulator [Thermodesulfobacteriota bacterium]|nr:helix-turn-helix transcriptional regulator [Thermodesulfobacteriota bacterium]